jgi:phage-related tail fiber protein
MSKVSASKKQHRSMRGKQVDMDLLRKRNELTPAVGNARVNARGDELGPGGQIIKKREDVVAEHYATAGRVQEASGRTRPVQTTQENIVEPAAAPIKKTVTRTKTEEAVVDTVLTAAEQEMLDEADAWVEDADGNFIPKGE